MKVLTKNLIIFALIFSIGAIVFRFGLSQFIENQLHSLVWMLAVLYFFFNFLIGWLFGKRDNESLPLYDIGFRFHFTAYLLFNTLSVLWLSSGFQSRFENNGIAYTIAIFWGIGILIHFIIYLLLRKNSISGINKEEIFE